MKKILIPVLVAALLTVVFVACGSKEEMNVLKKLSKKKYNICFVDGTHENFDLLKNGDYKFSSMEEYIFSVYF